MNSTPAELPSLIQASLDGNLTEAEAAQLNAELRTNVAAWDLYLQLADIHACLAVDEQLWVGEHRAETTTKQTTQPNLKPVFSRPLLCAALVFCLIVLGIVLGFRQSFVPALPVDKNRQVATFADLLDCRWVLHSTQVQVGDALQVGQRVELSSGTVSLLFASGAPGQTHRSRYPGAAVGE